MQEEADCVSDVLTVSVNKPVNLSKPVTFLLANNGTKVCLGTRNKTHTICLDSSDFRIIGFANVIHIIFLVDTGKMDNAFIKYNVSEKKKCYKISLFRSEVSPYIRLPFHSFPHISHSRYTYNMVAIARSFGLVSCC